MITDDSIDGLLQTKQCYEDNESIVLAKCPDGATQATARGAVQRARDNYNNAINRILCADDVLMRGLLGDLSDNRQAFEDLVQKDGALAMILNRMTNGIMIGTKILTLLR